MRQISGKELGKIVLKHGWVLLRIIGSHHIYGKEGSIVRLSIPVHGNKPLKIGLLKHFLKMAEMNETDIRQV